MTGRMTGRMDGKEDQHRRRRPPQQDKTKDIIMLEIGGPKVGNSILQNRTFYFGEPP